MRSFPCTISKKILILLIGILWGLLLLPAIGGNSPVSSTSSAPLDNLIKESENVNNRLKESKSNLKAIKQKEKEVFNSLDTIESTLNQVQIKIREIKKKSEALTGNMEKTHGSIQGLEKIIKDHKEYADKRIVALYKLNRLGGMAHVTPSEETMFDLIKQSNSFGRIINADEDRIIQYVENINRLNSLLETQKHQKSELEQLQSDLSQKQQVASAERKNRSKLLSKIQGQKQLELAAQDMLEKAAENLDKEIAAISKTASQPSAGQVSNKNSFSGQKSTKDSFAHLKGLLKMPVKGKVISNFGTYRNPGNNATLYRNGVDIRAERGEPIRAVFSGKVLYSNWFKGYGNMIIIDHGDHYYSIYANIDELFKTIGDPVEKNEVIATVGDTGSLKGPKLYFEIRHYGKPQDPMNWMQAG